MPTLLLLDDPDRRAIGQSSLPCPQLRSCHATRTGADAKNGAAADKTAGPVRFAHRIADKKSDFEKPKIGPRNFEFQKGSHNQGGRGRQTRIRRRLT